MIAKYTLQFLGGVYCVGLDAVMAKVPMYEAWGFRVAFKISQFQGDAQRIPMQ